MKANLVAIVSLVGLSASPITLHATPVDGIDIISQSYQITATWNAGFHLQDGVNQYFTGGYNLSSFDGSPLSSSTAPSLGFMGASASIDGLSLHDYSFCGSAGGTLFLGGTIQTHVQGVWGFRPAGDSLNIGLNIGAFYSEYGTAFGGLTVTLTDSTISSTLLSLVDPLTFATAEAYGYSGVNNYTFGVDPSHVYELAITGRSDSFDRDHTQLDLAATLSSSSSIPGPEPVPETASAVVSTFLLLPLGLHGALYLRCRKRAAFRRKIV